MRLLKSRHTGDPADTDLVDESPAEAVESVTAEDEAPAPEVSTEIDESDHAGQPPSMGRRIRWSRVIAFGVLPGLALMLASAAGFLKWQDGSVRDAQVAGAESVRAATDGTVALLSYKPDTVEKDLEAAQSRLTGSFLDSYTSLTHDVVIPGAKQEQISAVATVPAAAVVSTAGSHAVVLLFVNQTVSMGQNPPTNTASSVRVTLDKADGRWLISGFEPV